MPRFLSRSVLCTAALLCACGMVWADEAKDKLALSTQPTISLQATSTSQTDVAAFLKTPVSFTVKGASFLGALDAVLSASGKTCPIECRQMKPMKLTFGARGQSIDGVLDTLAKAGGGSLYIFPDKLLLSPAELLRDAEKASAKPYSVLISKLDKQPGGIDMLALANMKISCSINGNIGDALSACSDSLNQIPNSPLLFLNQRASRERIQAGLGIKDLSLSLRDVSLGEALGMLAHIDGCELYILPGKFLLCPPDGPTALTPDEQKVAVPAFQYPGTGLPGFGSPAPSTRSF